MNALLHLTTPFKNSVILSQIYDQMSYADIVLTCSDSGTINLKPVAHKVVLCGCSTYLKALLEGNPDSHELIIPDLNTSSMVRILELIYTGQVRVESREQISQVVDGIHLLGINSLVSQVEFSHESNGGGGVHRGAEGGLLHTQEEAESWPSSELISPISMEDQDQSPNWNDAECADVAFGVLSGGTGNKDIDTHPVSLIVSSLEEGAKAAVNAAGKKARKRALRRNRECKNVKKLKTDTDNHHHYDEQNGSHDQVILTEFKTDVFDANENFVPENQFSELLWKWEDEGFCFDLTDIDEQLNIFKEEERLQLITEGMLNDHSYASNK